MKVNNKDLIQSYILTTAKYDFTVTEKRILIRLVELMQAYTEGLELKYKYTITKTLFDDVDVVMPTSAFLKDEKDENYTRAKKALLSLNKKVVEYEDEKTWGALNIIERPAINKMGDCVSFRVSPTIAKVFLDFSKGYRIIELETIMNFKSTYAMRFYELLSGQKKPITYTIEHLKIMFKIEDKYIGKPNDFIRYVIIAAKKELDKGSPYSFEYKIHKKGRVFNSITFYPVYQPENRDPLLENKRLSKDISLRFDLDKIVIDYLKQNYIFTNQEIKNNLNVFKSAQNKIDLMLFLSENRVNASNKNNPKGWLINALKKTVEKNK